MKKLGLIAFAVALLGAGSPRAGDLGDRDRGDAAGLSTDRRVHGVITSIEPATLTIASSQRAVTGKIDPARTRVTVNGHAGKVGDLKLTAHAKGELCLDDVWLAIDTH